MLTVLALLAAGLLPPQEPSADLQRAFADQSPAARRQAAEQIVTLGEEAEEWILAQARKGSPERQRALLLAAALAGTERSFALLQDSLKKGQRPDPQRAYVLFLYGAFHPEGASQPDTTLKLAASEFERCCYLGGLLARARGVPLAAIQPGPKEKPDPALLGLLRLFPTLQAAAPAEEPRQDPELAVALLGSVLPGNPAVPRTWIERGSGRLPPLWLVAAARSPARTLESLRQEPGGGEGSGLALALYELGPEAREDAFRILRERLVEPVAQAWLWGAAGDLGLQFPEALAGPLSDAQVAGLLRLALRDPDRAAKLAAQWRAPARARFHAKASIHDHWPAALVLALAADDEEKASDKAVLQACIEASDGRADERARLHPIWQLATGRLGDDAARAGWLRRWSRELHAGYLGLLDGEGRRLVAYLLTNGTQAAKGRSELSFEAPGLTGPRDHSKDDELYADLAELILSDLYHIDLP